MTVAVQRARKRHKYGAVRCEWNGVLFDSKAERLRAWTLDNLLVTKRITWWSYGPRFILQDDPLITYRPDFLVRGILGVTWAEDVKGVQTAEFKLKAKLWAARYPDIELRVVR